MTNRSYVPLSGTTIVPAGAAGGTEAAARVADVLYLFTTGPALLGVSAIARELDLSKAVVYRILQSLASRQFVEADVTTRAYRLGPRAVALGARVMRDLDLRAAARPVLRGLRAQTGETTTLSELVGDARVYLDQFESQQVIRMMVELGRPHPLHAGGTGKAMLAFLGQEVRDRVLAGNLERLTSATVTDRSQLRDELAEVVRRGYAVSLGERQHDAGSVATPVFGVDGEVVGAISVCGPVGRFGEATIQSHASRVLAAGAEVSRSMGWNGRWPTEGSR